jgi:ethanolamine phosphate transferase 2 subunit G
LTLGSACSTVAVFVCLRLIRGWNQTGQKFAGSPDLVKIFLAPNPALLWILIFGAYAMVTFELMDGTRGLSTVISRPVIIGLVASAISFKIAFTNEDAPELVVGPMHSLLDLLGGASLVARARAVFLGLALVTAYPVYLVFVGAGQKALRLLHSLYTLLALTQSRATNIPLFILFSILHGHLEQLDLGVAEITTSSLLLQFTSFFALGGSNAISSVDLSSAYNGISDFNVVTVGLLTFIGNWAGPVWWTLATTRLLLQRGASLPSFPSVTNRYQMHISLLTVFVAASLGFVMAACTALRTHLFIWTVFSPKYLYGMAWSLGQHLGINVGVGGLLFWLGSRGIR